jgi:hypothetical protein
LLLAGCYEVELRVNLLPTGEVMLTHAVSLPSPALNMRLSSMGATPAQAEKELTQLAQQDAALIGATEIIDLELAPAGDKMRVTRRIVFADGARLARYFELLGLTAKTELTKKRASLAVEADHLDIEKLARLGRFFEKQDKPAGSPAGAALKGGATLTLKVSLPDAIEQATPPGRREGGAVVWTVPEDAFGQPFKVDATAKLGATKPLAVGPARPFDGAAADRALAAVSPPDARDYLRRMGGRVVPILHARIGEKGQTDLALLWTSDEVSRDAERYHRRLDALMIPETAQNDYQWIEALQLEDRRVVADGWRSREDFEPKELGGAIAVAKVEGKWRLTFTAPRLYAGAAAALAGPPDRVVGVLVVSSPKGKTKHAPVTVADLQAGKAITLEP